MNDKVDHRKSIQWKKLEKIRFQEIHTYFLKKGF